jgi:hypothetical protein
MNYGNALIQHCEHCPTLTTNKRERSSRPGLNQARPEGNVRAQAAPSSPEWGIPRQELPKEQWVVRRHPSDPGKERAPHPAAESQAHIVKAQ